MNIRTICYFIFCLFCCIPVSSQPQCGAERLDVLLPLLQGKRVTLAVNQTSLCKNTHLLDTLCSRNINIVQVFAPEHGFRGLPLLQGKRVTLAVNQTSLCKNTHLLDTLCSRNINIVQVFAPEHGFRGNADAGETIKDGRDTRTGIRITSLYGKSKKPQATQLAETDAVVFDIQDNADAGETIKDGRDTRTGIRITSLYGKSKKPQATQLAETDAVVFDIQDVGARFYTYISTLYYIMQACAENQKEMIVLDRPNPCDYIDGPILQPAFKSFVGMLPIPVLHGCTVGELAIATGI